MGDQGRWFKLWVSATADPDLRNMSLEGVGRWCLFGAFLKVHGKRGHLIIKSPALALQDLFRVASFEAVKDVLQGFPNCSVTEVTNSPVTLEIEWLNWHKYQDDASGDRVRRWRAEQRKSRNAIKKRGEETKKRREEQPPPDPPPAVEFSIPKSILDALDQSSHLRTIPALRNPIFWRAEVRANEGVDFGREVLKAEAWLVSHPNQAHKQDWAKFMHGWLGRAEREG